MHTPHGIVDTPCFMPVGTQASVKTLGSEDLETLGFRLVLANTYHLSLRPGAERIQRLGGLHRFMGWSGALLTDSGGFQVMSLSSLRKIEERGVSFRSHLDGSELFLSPETAIAAQAQLGVDISMALDVCPPYPATHEQVRQAVELTGRWAERNLAAAVEGQAVFGIVQGGVYEELRAAAAAQIGALPFAGTAIGGVSVGEPTELQRPVVEFTTRLLPEARPRYLMGVGHPADILHAVACGVDMFDCVLPTRMARHCCAYTLDGRFNLTNARWAEHSGPIDNASVFSATERYSAAYIWHLLRAREPLGARLLTLHNLAFYGRLMAEIRTAIANGGWQQLCERYARA